ncbi:hypothetical protein GCM10023165_18900 [Variovorax defluvii]|uniref:Type III secretion system chaperone n=1 Tax=Variovorax defluvii TaxID=913761 RepID=A0ABP8HI42_9BURK
MDSDHVARLLVELGGRTPRIESIVQEADVPRWAIELEDGLVVIAELDQERTLLSLETDLGRPPEKHRLATCEALMIFTSLKHASHGFAMALGEPGGDFQLCGHVLMTEFDSEKFQSNFFAFADCAQQWKEIITRDIQQDFFLTNEIFSNELRA